MLNLRVSEDTKAQLEHLAEASGRRQSDLAGTHWPSTSNGTLPDLTGTHPG